jgi:predicted nucleotidyltransferase
MFHMEHNIDYKLEVVNELLKEKNHIRNLAKRLKTNHMTVLRRIKDLFDSNIVDYKEEGKNKVYFLKDTMEARTTINMAEGYKLIKIVKKYPDLRRIIEKFQENKKIHLAVLFGSYAKEIPRKESDIDIYIETTTQELKKELEKFDSKLSIKIGKYNKDNLIIKEIKKNHIIIKGIERYYEIS